MEYAKGVLEKQGWSEGKGLGRAEQGRSEAIKVTLKFDTKGIGESGHDNFEWWNHAFNQASSNIVVDSDSDGEVTVESKTARTGMLSTRPPVQAAKTMFYGGFVKAGALSMEQKDHVIKMTDKELFEATGGLTGHKSARHGHKLGGKLARLAEADRLLAETIATGVDFAAIVKDGATHHERKRKSTSKNEGGTANATAATTATDDGPEGTKKSRKKTTKGKRKEADREPDPAAEKALRKKAKKAEKKTKEVAAEAAAAAAAATAEAEPKDKQKKRKKEKKSKKKKAA